MSSITSTPTSAIIATSTYSPSVSYPTATPPPSKPDDFASVSFFGQYLSFSPLFLTLIIITLILILIVTIIHLYRENCRRKLAKKCTQQTVDQYTSHVLENSPVNDVLPSYSSAGCEPAVPEAVVQNISRQAYESIIDMSRYQPTNVTNPPVTSQLPPAYEQLEETTPSPSYVRPSQ
ncbi:hypothetical protein K7432_002548 [Basidiobolus ranarum]|uniref:Uncharacterized protein n=1 Tax=Basidiobolus ranarum TaxID=34480 RepID=A0ABR2W7U0_9FUNG